MTREEYNKEKSNIMARKWKDPAYRAAMIEKQIALGFRKRMP